MAVGRIFLVEAYAPSTSEFDRLSDQARNVAAHRAGRPAITHIRSIHVPEDEICFHLFEADSAASVARAMEGAQMRAQRIVEVRS